MTASASRSRICVTTPAATWARRSATLCTCLYRDGAATPARLATAVRVSASTPSASMISMAMSVTAATDSPALGTVDLRQERQHGLAGRLGCLGDRVVAAAGQHHDVGLVAAPGELLLDP